MDERQIYEAVKRILSANGNIDIDRLQRDLKTGTENCAAPASTGDTAQYQNIKRIMENTMKNQWI